MRRDLLLAACLLALGACEIPDDGVLALAFLLETPPAGEARVAPPESDTGLPPFAFAAARGRCDVEPPRGEVRCTISGLPPAPAGRAFTYRLGMLVDYAPVPPRFDGRSVDRDPGGQDPDAPPRPATPPLPRAALGAIAPDVFGAVDRTFAPTGVALDRVVGGELHLEVLDAAGAPTRHLVLDGRLGNLPDEAGRPAEPARPAPGGHHHH